jgi:molybdopterin converting factor small subunit
MKIHVVPYAEIRRKLGTTSPDLWLDVPEGATVGDALRMLGLSAGEVVSQDAEAGKLIVGLNGVHATEDTPLSPNAELTLVTQMMGGATRLGGDPQPWPAPPNSPRSRDTTRQ